MRKMDFIRWLGKRGAPKGSPRLLLWRSERAKDEVFARVVPDPLAAAGLVVVVVSHIREAAGFDGVAASLAARAGGGACGHGCCFSVFYDELVIVNHCFGRYCLYYNSIERNRAQEKISNKFLDHKRVKGESARTLP